MGVSLSATAAVIGVSILIIMQIFTTSIPLKVSQINDAYSEMKNRAVEQRQTDISITNITDVGWWDTDWDYRKMIIVDHAKIQADQVDFPVLIRRSSDADLADHAQSDGDDIVFASDDNKVKFNYEIEEYNSVTGELTAWVKIPTISANKDTVLYMYYGNSGCSSQQNMLSTWDSNFRMVQHLNESAGTLYDSTSNGNDGTNNGATYNASSKIDGGYDFNGSVNINCGNDGSLDITNSITLEAWVKDPPSIIDEKNTSDVRTVNKRDEESKIFKVANHLSSNLGLTDFLNRFSFFKNNADFPFNRINDKKSSTTVSDEEPYTINYFKAPENSFGFYNEGEIKKENWSNFWEFFDTYSKWRMDCYRIPQDYWTNVTDYLIISDNKSADNGNLKTNLEFTAPYGGNYNISFTIDRPLRSYYNDSLHNTYYLNYTSDQNEIYHAFFNFSDIRAIGLFAITPEIINNKFKLSVRRDNVPAGFHVIIDPTFGSATSAGTATSIAGIIGGGYFKMGNNSGVATRITAYIATTVAGRVSKCALYDISGNYVTNSQTEVITHAAITAAHWQMYNIPAPYPVLKAGQYYYIVCWADASTNLYRQASGGLGYYAKTQVYAANFPSTATYFTGLTVTDADARADIYCNYTVNENLSQYPTYPTNNSVFRQISAGSFNVPLQMGFYSGKGRKMNATLQYNTTAQPNTWTTFNTSTNINNGTFTYRGTSWINAFNKKYWFKVILNDGMGLWNNQTYSFTTARGYPVQNDVVWNNNTKLADLTAYNDGRKIVRGSDGTLYAIYRYKLAGGTTTTGWNNIRFAKSTDNGVSWSYVNITASTAYAQNYPSIAINSTGGLHIVWDGGVSSATALIREIHSSDGGATWTSPVTVSGPYTTRAQNVPSIAIDSNDNMYVVWYGGNQATANTQIRFSKSTNGGTTWSAPTNITTSIGATYYLQQYPSIAIDNSNNLYVVWNGRYSGASPGSLYHIRFSKSTNGGTTWSAATNISTLTTAYDQLNPCIALDNANGIRVVWYGRAVAAIAQTQIRYTASTNGGTTWSASYNISRNIAYNQQYPSIAVDNGNNLHVVWQGLHAGSTTKNQIRYSKYTASWSAPSNLTTTTDYVSNYPNLLWGNFPNVSGKEIDAPQTGYALVYASDNNNIIYYNSTDLTWPDIEKPTSAVNNIAPYWKSPQLIITATASDTGSSGLKNVTLYYYNSTNNATWGGPWKFGSTNTTPWINPSAIPWSFTFPNGTGYYRFYSRAYDNATNQETFTGNDTKCGYDTVAPSSSVSPISPYWKKSTPTTITATASDATSGVKNVTLWYRFSSNNASWGGWVNAGVDTASPWSWSFSFANNGTGYYQFYSIARDNATNAESAPGGNGDANCGYDNVAPTSSVDTIAAPYWKTTTPLTLTATASDGTGLSGLKNVTLYYYNSTNNATWGGPWKFGNTNSTPWITPTWNFNFPNGTGYYRFYSVAYDNATNQETFTGNDTKCGYDNVAPSSSVTAITPYWKTSSPQTLSGTASDTGSSGLKNVTLWYRYRATNASSWGGWVSSGLVDTDPWVAVSWSFTFPNGTGHYEFYSIALDNATNVESAPGSADTKCGYNNIPTITNPGPSNGSTEISLTPQMNITVNDLNGDTMTIKWYSNSSGTWKQFGVNYSATNGTHHQINTNFSGSGTTYWWNVSVSDDQDTNNSAIYHFTTRIANSPTQANENPANSSVGISIIPQLSLYVDDPNDDTLNAYWYSNSSGTWKQFAVNTSIDTSSGAAIIRQTNTNFSINGQKYYWSVNVTDENLWINITYHFTTNYKPTQTGETPVNQSISVDKTPSLHVICSDTDGDTMTAYWYSNSSDTWKQFAVNASVSSGTNITQTNTNFSGASTKYWWSVNLTDGKDWANYTYYFTTRATYMPDAPSNFNATTNGRFQIDLTWTNHSYADTTRVEWHTTNDPTWNVGEHNLLYNGSAESTSQTSLNPGTTRYYKAWSFNQTDAVWSTGVTDYNTTENNGVPTQTGEKPANGSTAVSLTPTINVTVDDGDDDTLNAYWYSNSSESWIQFAVNTNIDTSGGAVNIQQTNNNFSKYNTIYWWSVNLTDGYSWANRTYHFTTTENMNTSVDMITPYLQTSSPLTINATTMDGTPDNVTLYYRRSVDNISWDGGKNDTIDYVDNSGGNIDGVPDVGTHSNFANQQSPPDNIYDTLTETTGGSFDTEYVESLGTSSYSADINWQTKATITINPSTESYYVILATGSVRVASTTVHIGARLTVAGSTCQEIRYMPKDASDWYPFVALKVIQLSSPTTVNLDYMTYTAGTAATIRDARIIALNVTYAAYDEDEARVTTTSAIPQTRSSISVTPNGASENFIVIATANLDGSLITESARARIYNSDGTTITDYIEEPGVATTAKMTFGSISRVTLTQTRTLSLDYCSETSMTTGIQYSHIVAIPEAAFNNVYYSYDDSEVSPAVASTWYTKVNNVYTPVAGDHLIIGMCQDRSQSTTSSSSFRLTFAGTNDNDYLKEDKDTTDYRSAFSMTRSTLTATQKTDSIGYWAEVTTADFKNARLFSIELTPPACKLNLEQNWTNVDYSQKYEELCIKTGTTGAENISVDVWTGSWVNLLKDLTASSWNNISVSDYLTSNTFTIRFKGGNESSDWIQDMWQIDTVLLHTWNDTNDSLGCNWRIWSDASNPDTAFPWSWNFNFPNGTGYYEFYSIGKKVGYEDELAPSVADAICHYFIPNMPPVLTNETPKNASTNINLNPILSIQVNDSEGQLMNITWYWGTDSSCPNFIGTNNSIDNGTYFMTNDNNFSAKGQTYYWRLTVNDGSGGWTNITFHFKTTGVNKEIISKEKTAYSLEISADSTMLYGFINNTNVTTPIDTNWHYVVLTYDGTTIKLYEDGKLKNSTTLIGNIPTNNNDLMLGDRLTGTLDELRISAIARSPEWINATYKMTSSPTSFIEVESEQNQQHTYLNITIENTGSTTIKTQDCTLLINGTKTSFVCIQTCFYPLKETNIFVNVSAVGSKRNKFITGNGIIDYEGYG
ncbi:MAG: DUF2341 domain-containing protein [Euryarchaeota archaeon]|nr:DUF2341 domain-containing protein [Euryarchaeota archaeon]